MHAMFSRAMKAFGSSFGWLAAPALGLLSACGVGFDPASEITTLRVLAVQKDAPYAAAGTTANLRMLWHDGSERAGRPVQVAWLPPCFNPPGGFYYSCFPQLIENIGIGVTEGNTFSVQIPEDIVEQSEVPAEGQPRSGLTYVFFALCAGTLGIEQPEERGALPLVCRDENGASLGPEDFVAGYTTLYTFPEGFQNANPTFRGFEVAGEEVAEVCTDTSEGGCSPVAGEPAPAELDCTGDAPPSLCVSACEDDGDPECPEIEIRPLLDEAPNVEPDSVAAAYYDRNITEQMWINYYVDRGGVESEVRLLNDAMVGWNEDNGTKFFAPKEPGLVHVWAVAHDNRGGVAWARVRLQVF